MTLDDLPPHPRDAYTGPAAPWKLRGSIHVSVWRVPVRDLPIRPPAGTQVVSLAGQALVVAAWATYEPGGTLSYNELLVAAGVRAAGLLVPAVTVGPIWVDDEVAAAGGRSLWGIPKQLGVFARQAAPGPSAGATDGNADATSASLHVQGHAVAALDFEPRQRMALPIRATVWTVQDGQAGPLRTRCTLRGRLRPGVARWRFAADGPLAFLHGRQPLASVRLEPLSASFGV